MSPEKGSPKAENELGREIAKRYIAAQGVSQELSEKACRDMEGASAYKRYGFNSEMRKSPYNVRAYAEHVILSY